MAESQDLLIRGGTSSIGLTTLTMAKAAGLRVISTSRSEAKAAVLRDAGADDVVIDTGSIEADVLDVAADSPAPSPRPLPPARARQGSASSETSAPQQRRRSPKRSAR